MTDLPQNFPDGTLMIRDNGPGTSPNVEFWFYAADQTKDYGLVQFEKKVNGVVTQFSVSLRPHMGWFQVSVDNAILTQYVTWQLDTQLGSSHAGYPYSYTVYISRPTPPTAPPAPWLSNVSVDRMTVGIFPPYDGGATIDGYQIGYGTNSSGPTTIVNGISPYLLTNLAMGSVYYVWVRAHNYQGWGDWSPASSARTYLGAYVNVSGVWKIAIPYLNVSGVWKQVEPIIHHS